MDFNSATMQGQWVKNMGVFPIGAKLHRGRDSMGFFDLYFSKTSFPDIAKPLPTPSSTTPHYDMSNNMSATCGLKQAHWWLHATPTGGSIVVALHFAEDIYVFLTR